MTARPERVPAEEVRQRMLEAGRELAIEAGAALTIEHLRLEEVIQRARVPRSSVYRLWPYREEYIDDLLCYLAGAGNWFNDRPVFDPETFTVLRQAVEDNRELLATPDGRRALLCEIVRLTVAQNYAALTESGTWRLHMALSATLGSTRSGVARQQIAAALEESQRRSRESLVAVFGFLAAELGLRLRDPACDARARAARRRPAGPARGAAQRAGPGAAADGDDCRGGGPGGRPAQRAAARSRPARAAGRWTLAAFAYLGVIDAFIELDPDFTPPER